MDFEGSFSSEASFLFVPAEINGTPPTTKTSANLSRYFPREFPWTYDNIQETIRARNEQPDGLLFIDNLLELVEIDGPTYYPPHSPEALSELLDVLLASPHGLLKSHSIIFYLCLAASSLSGSSSSSSSNYSSLPTAFARDYLLPTGYVRSIEGFHSLDSRDFQAAVSALTDPHLTPDFVEKTLQILSTLPRDVSERSKLVLSYWELSGIEIGGEGEEAEKMMGWVLEALCDSERPLAFRRAWAMMRAWNDEAGRQSLAMKILVRCFGGNPFNRPLPSHLHSLISSPLSPAEETLLHSFCLSPPLSLTPHHATLAADFLISKYIASGQLLQAMKAGREIEDLGRVGGQERRGRLLRGVRETLTEVQKMSVDLEGEIAIGPVQASAFKAGKDAISATQARVTNVTQPAWMPAPASTVTATAISTSTPLKKPIARIGTPTVLPPSLAVADLPLSASPFLRREKQLVGTKDGMPGSSSGGAQKTLLRAMMDSGAGKAVGGFGGSGAGQKEKERKVTLKGFGSIRRTPSFSMNGSSAGASERSWGGRSTPGNVDRSIPRRMELQQDDSEDDDNDDPMQLRSPSPPPAPTPKATSRKVSSKAPAPSTAFAVRANQDPAIASAIAAAVSDDASPPKLTSTPAAKLTKSKRRTFSTQHSEIEADRDKRRAVSTEPADSRPTSALQVGAGRLPGAFPGGEEEPPSTAEPKAGVAGGRRTGRRTTTTKADAERETEPVKSRRKTSTATTTPAPVRRSARASSVVPASPAPVTPRAKPRTTSTANDTPRTSAIRRSARLGTSVPVTRSSRMDVVTTDEETGDEA